MSAMAAQVGHFFGTYASHSGNGTDGNLLHGMFVAVGTFVPLACGIPKQGGYQNKTASQDKEEQKVVGFSFGRSGGTGAFVQYLTYGLDACHHTGIPVAFAQVRVHVAGLDTFADGIGEDTFQSVAGGKLDAPFLGNQQDDQSVVFAFLTDAIFLTQLVSEVKAVASFYLTDSHDQGLDTGLLLQGKKGGIHDGYGCFA